MTRAVRRGDEAARAFGRRTLETRYQRQGDRGRAVDLMKKHKARADTVERARHYGAIARDGLGIFADGPEKSALVEIIDFCIERTY